MRIDIRKRLILLVSLSCFTTTALAQDDIRLPDMGSPADAVLSKNDEARLGRAIMAQIRASTNIVEDPIITEYINDVGSRIAAHTNNGDFDFTFFVVEDSSINAFALPGGYIGVHTGLIEATRNEDELAGVLGHEIAHVTQRHIARAIHAAQRQGLVSSALMLATILAGVAGADSDVVQAGMAVSQGSAIQQRINFTRSNEHEADRIGINALADAGFDPYGMASFFEVMSRMQPSDMRMRLPEFLRTHPVTTDRIAEARTRARTLPRVDSEDSPNYGIARARAKVQSFERADQAISYYQARDYSQQTDVERYGRAVAYQRDQRYRDALKIFEDLVEKDKKIIAYHIGYAESLLELERYDEGTQAFDRAVGLFPRNVPLIIHYGEWLIRLNRANEAHAVLLDLLNNVPPTPEQVRLIARAANEAGDRAESLYYLSEYRLMTGDLPGGISMLRRALALPELKEIQRIRFEARIDFIREFMTEEQLKQLQRSRAPGMASVSR